MVKICLFFRSPWFNVSNQLGTKNTRSVKSQPVEEKNDWLFEILGNITRLQKNAVYKQTVRSQCLASDAVPIQKDFPVSIENSLNRGNKININVYLSKVGVGRVILWCWPFSGKLLIIHSRYVSQLLFSFDQHEALYSVEDLFVGLKFESLSTEMSCVKSVQDISSCYY